MNDQNENDLLERELKSWRRDQTPAKDLVPLQQRMRDRWASLEGSSADSREDEAPLRQTRWMVPSVLMTTAAAAVLLLGWFLHPGSVLAQATRAIEAAQSVFAVRTYYDDEGHKLSLIHI